MTMTMTKDDEIAALRRSLAVERKRSRALGLERDRFWRMARTTRLILEPDGLRHFPALTLADLGTLAEGTADGDALTRLRETIILWAKREDKAEAAILTGAANAITMLISDRWLRPALYRAEEALDRAEEALAKPAQACPECERRAAEAHALDTMVTSIVSASAKFRPPPARIMEPYRPTLFVSRRWMPVTDV